MADGDYERGRGREIGAIAAKLKRLAAARANGARPLQSRQHEPHAGHRLERLSGVIFSRRAF